MRAAAAAVAAAFARRAEVACKSGKCKADAWGVDPAVRGGGKQWLLAGPQARNPRVRPAGALAPPPAPLRGAAPHEAGEDRPPRPSGSFPGARGRQSPRVND
jgi:hypothetical protein